MDSSIVHDDSRRERRQEEEQGHAEQKDQSENDLSVHVGIPASQGQIQEHQGTSQRWLKTIIKRLYVKYKTSHNRVESQESLPSQRRQDTDSSDHATEVQEPAHVGANEENPEQTRTPGAFAVYTQQTVSRNTRDLQAENEALSAEVHNLRSQIQDQSVLVQAEAVHPVEDMETERDDGLSSEERRTQRKRMAYRTLGLSITFVAVAIAVGVPLALRSSSSGSSTPEIPPNQWQQLGQDLNGIANGDSFGRSVSLSGDATVLAVGADQTSPDPGYVSIFQLDEESLSWIQKGQDVVGEANGDNFGWSVSLSEDGNVLAVGAHLHGDSDTGHVRIYEYNDTTSIWSQRGDDIDGEEVAGDRFGFSVSLSNDGNVVAVGAYLSDTASGVDSGSVRSFQYNSDTQSWTQRGQTLIGQAAGDRFGYSVSIGGSGSIVAVGATENDSGGNDGGQVSVYTYNSESLAWVPMGSPMNGTVDSLLSWSVALSDNGPVMAVGSPGAFNSFLGRVFTFEYDSTISAWTQRGPTLVSDVQGNEFGLSVSLSDDGNFVAVGSPSSSGVGLTNSGRAQVFQYNTTEEEWSQVGDDLYGEAEFDRFGEALSLSGNGTVIGVGARVHGTSDLGTSGYVRVFKN